MAGFSSLTARFWLQLCCVFVVISPGYASAFQVELDQETLQSQLDGMFPVTKKEPLMTVSVLRPEVLLNGASNRIGLRVALFATFPDDINYSGVAVVDSKLRYDKANNAIYLAKPIIRFLEIEGVPAVVVKEIRTIGNRLLRQYLSQTPLYLLGSLSQSKTHLTGASIRDGKLVLDLAMK